MKRKRVEKIAIVMMGIGLLVGMTACRSGQTQDRASPAHEATARGNWPVIAFQWNEERQRVDGFGGSDAFGQGLNLAKMREPIRTELLDMLFSRDKGIGLNILRLQLGDGDGDTIEPEPGKFVWDQPGWDKDLFDFGQVWLAREAKKRGLTTILSTAWSPPAWMKTNNSVSGKDGKLKKEDYQAYADYLAAYVTGYKKYFDLDISYISFQNEPDARPDYSGCIWTPDEMNAFVRDYLSPTFKKKQVPAKIVMPENMHFTEEYAVPALNDPVTVNDVDIVATHAYGINSMTFPVSREKGKTIWQTEYMNQGKLRQSYENNTIADALRQAGLIGDMFDTTGISAFLWWWPAAENGADGSDLIRLDTFSDTFRVFKRYYAFGNYSRFIRPGYVAIGSDNKPANGVLVTAYKDPDTGSYAIVAVNDGSEDRTFTFDLHDFPAGSDAVVPYRTSASENLRQRDDVELNKDGHSFTALLRGGSVTTFVPKSAELPAMRDLKDVFSTFEAEENDGQSREFATQNDGNGLAYLANLREGDSIKYANVNFGNGTANGEKPGVLSMNALLSPLARGRIEVKLDDPANGKTVGMLEIPAPDAGKPGQWETVSSLLDSSANGAYGVHDLYLVFKGGDGKPLANVDTFAFGDAGDRNFRQQK